MVEIVFVTMSIYVFCAGQFYKLRKDDLQKPGPV